MALLPVDGIKTFCANCGLSFSLSVSSSAAECPFCEKLGADSLVRKIKHRGPGGHLRKWRMA